MLILAGIHCLTGESGIKIKSRTMARPIRNTPILTGNDATAFINAAEKYTVASGHQSERARLDKSVANFKAMLASLPR